MYLFPVAEGNDLDRFVGAPDEFDIVLYQEAHGENKIWSGRDHRLPALSTISTELNDKSVNVGDYFNVSFTQFVSGEMDVNDDAVWAEYFATLEEYGLNEIIAAYEEYFGM